MPDRAPQQTPSWLIAMFAVVAYAFPKFGAKKQPSDSVLRNTGGARPELGTTQKGSRAFGNESAADEPTHVQHQRGREQGHGRDAAAPTEIPWKGWKDIALRTYEEIGKDRVLAVAAGVVFYGLLATVPAITAFVSLYALLADASTIREHMAMGAGFVPAGVLDIVGQQIDRIAANQKGLSFAAAFGILVALWSANAGVKAIFDALNVCYDEEEKRGFIKLNLVSLAFTLGGIVFLGVAVGAVVAFPIIFAFLGMESWGKLIASLARWPILFAVLVLALSVLYRFGPSRENPRWSWVTPGSMFAAFTWVVASAAFSYYLAKFADYNATYGSLGAVIGLMTWMWISCIVILVGAEVNAEVEHQTARDTTEGGSKPIGARGAAMADTVGEAKS